MKSNKHKYSLIIFTFILLFSLNSVIMNANGQDEEVLFLRVSKIVGTTSLDGDKIEGDFKITGSGPDYIVNLTLFFNGTQEDFESGNELEFRFKTEEYPFGLMNITLVGKDNIGTTYTKTIFKDFVSPTYAIWIIIIAGSIAIISISLKKLIPYLKDKRKEKQGATEKKSNIKIKIDKEFL
ncbi:hypothetical protein DSAG12_01073 [Promethearchaeum syntrophicum]|uniref:Uncharacterized protein n=1 Tax=Promethearchaeum syntrophicum TaxID=2594042 RepID=A0A5B9D7Q2_9ARCH|nr:hypothetical protein [Candidatus Prometheoarchaeum syntrophicum]QEE15248.1 hypothetical protein DSAG12_01073 [Candidatus Prometheoarchaeum syntrophicum]